MMKVRRPIGQEEVADLDLISRIKLERDITDAKAGEAVKRSIPANGEFDDYKDHSPWKAYLFDFLGSFAGRTVLDLGCGYLPTAVYFALAGAKRVYACDVSPKAVAFVRQIAEATGVADRVSVLLCAGEQLPFANETMDLIHGEGVLHHLYLPLAGSEIARVLKSGGKGAFKDPLGHNPLLELARDYLPRRGKKAVKGTDRSLKLGDIERFGKNFSVCSHREFQLFSMIFLLLPNRGNSGFVQLAIRLDDHFLRCFSFLRPLCRYVVTGVKKCVGPPAMVSDALRMPKEVRIAVTASAGNQIDFCRGEKDANATGH